MYGMLLIGLALVSLGLGLVVLDRSTRTSRHHAHLIDPNPRRYRPRTDLAPRRSGGG